MILYHFTSGIHWSQIEQDGQLKPTDPVLRKDVTSPTLVISNGAGSYALGRNVGGRVIPASEWMEQEEPPTLYDLLPPDHDLGPLVVHLTKDHRACTSVPSGKLNKRITVDVADAEQWLRWARRQGIDEKWLKELRAGHPDSKEWFVVERPILREEWVEVIAIGDREVHWERSP